MGSTDQILWPLKPHTLGKHLVLKSYLDAWLPIMGSKFGRILFIDGFAGPGEYKDGEMGSPLIALGSLKNHASQKKITAEIIFDFIESEIDRAQHLDSLVSAQKSSLPANCKTHVINAKFDEALTSVLDRLDDQKKKLAPAFVMIDPFGVSDTPMDVVARILQNDRSEVYISFMYESINRFKSTDEFAPHLDELFGTDEWRSGAEIKDTEERKNFFFDLYKLQLRSAGANHVVHFELYEKNRLVYAIFFGTHHSVGADRMKAAIWKVAPFGDFEFHGTHSSQLLLGVTSPNFEPLKSSLQNQFKDKGWLSIEEIKEFVASDKTDYHTGQFKKGAFRWRRLEKSRSKKALGRRKTHILTARNCVLRDPFSASH